MRWELPDLIVVDGGKPQLSAAIKVLNKYKLKIPVIGLAKKEEEIYIYQGKGKQAKRSARKRSRVPNGTMRSNKLKLSLHSPALQIVQHLRDEAHRFANRYREKLTRNMGQRQKG